jgi:antiviral helicase SLH1
MSLLDTPIDELTPESDWLVRLTEMQDAIAALKISLPKTSDEIYGKNLDITDEDFSGYTDQGSDEIFDYNENVDEYFSDESYSDAEAGFNIKWLERMCHHYCSRNSSGQSYNGLVDSILTVLRRNSSNDELQAPLADIVGYEDLDMVTQLIIHRSELVESAKVQEMNVMNDDDGIIRGLMSKEEREEALRQLDREHKSRPLGPKLAEAADNYPHVYRAHKAGNMMSAFGKKYSLPVGSTEIQENGYTELRIPPTKVGAVGAGEKLVLISEMDMLCQKTFVGYKTLNRMQSLVYPVAYKTNENMLICAPTGAVRPTPFPVHCFFVFSP